MNDENLKPINERADFIELSRKGGIKSGIARREKSKRNKIAKLYLDAVFLQAIEEPRGNKGKMKSERTTNKLREKAKSEPRQSHEDIKD